MMKGAVLDFKKGLMPSRIAREGFSGVEGIFLISTQPLFSMKISVKVPPVSTPMRTAFFIWMDLFACVT
jgi:hypothetical protein